MPAQKAGTPSKKAEMTPEKAGTPPKKAGMTPEKAGAPPKKAGTPPKKAGMTPEKAGTPPKKAVTPLAHVWRLLKDARPMAKYTRAQLSKASGEAEHIIERNVKRGLVPWAVGTGSQRHYTDDHLHRLFAIRALRQAGVRAAELARRMREATDDEIRELAGVPAAPGGEPAAARPVRSHQDVHRLLDAVVIAAADAIDVAPKRARLVVEAAIAQMKKDGVSVEEAAAAIAARAGASR
jgi:DNA-binding transcriptional MerR regulator